MSRSLTQPLMKFVQSGASDMAASESAKATSSSVKGSNGHSDLVHEHHHHSHHNLLQRAPTKLLESLLPAAERPQNPYGVFRSGSWEDPTSPDASGLQKTLSESTITEEQEESDAQKPLLTRDDSTQITMEDLPSQGVQPSRRRSLVRHYAGQHANIRNSLTCHKHKKDISGRIMDRDGNFGQSNGHWHLGTAALREEEKEEEVEDLFAMDWYHTFLDTKFSSQMMIFVIAYISCFVFFAVVFLLIEKPCGLALEGSFRRAFLLSVESMMTVGYGIPDPYMEGCWQGPPVLTVMVLLQLLISALLVGVVFQGISRPQARANTVIFSDQAVIRCIDGVHYLMFRVCDLRVRHSLIEAHVRCYCVHRHPQHGYQTTPMRLEHPDDDLGGSLLLTLPYTVVHRIDAWSPLAPCVAECKDGGKGDDRDHHRTFVWPGTLQRQFDSESGNRSSCVCPFCGSSFGTATQLQVHCYHSAKGDVKAGLPEEHCHRELTKDELQEMSHEDPTREDLHTHLTLNFAEVVVLVEGIEPTTSSTLQARHSYLVGGPNNVADVSWDMEFAECVRVPHEGNAGLMLDLGRFHMLVPEDQ